MVKEISIAQIPPQNLFLMIITLLQFLLGKVPVRVGGYTRLPPGSNQERRHMTHSVDVRGPSLGSRISTNKRRPWRRPGVHCMLLSTSSLLVPRQSVFYMATYSQKAILKKKVLNQLLFENFNSQKLIKIYEKIYRSFFIYGSSR